MPNGSAFLTAILAPGGGGISNQAITMFRLQALQRHQLQTINLSDGAGSYIKACLSIADAFTGLGRGFASWAVVNLYYAVFYSAKAQLQLSGECHVYFNSRPYSIESRLGAAFRRGKGTSHDYAFEQFVARFNGVPSLSQEIGNEAPLHWLKSLREEIQYRSACFGDFAIETVLPRFVVSSAVRIMREYLGRDSALYAFDPDHAGIAFPLFFFAETSARLALGAHRLITPEQFQFFERRCRLGRDRIGLVIDLVRPLVI